MLYKLRNTTTKMICGIGDVAHGLGLKDHKVGFDFCTSDINAAYKYKEAMTKQFASCKYEVEEVL